MKAPHQNILLNSEAPINVFFTNITEFPPHWHEAAEVICSLGGSLRVGVNGEIYTINHKDILIVTGGDVHYFLPQPNMVDRLILHFELTYFESMCPNIKNKRFAKNLYRSPKVYDSPSCDDQVFRLLERQIDNIIRENKERKGAYKIALRARLYDTLAIILSLVPMQDYTPQEQNRHLNRLGRLENVFMYVEKNYCSEITLKEISAIANFNEYYFTRFFKEATGMTLGKYIKNFRVEKAAQFLKSTDDAITEICFKSGFNSTKTFNRVFKQLKGCSPMEYKKSIFEV